MIKESWVNSCMILAFNHVCVYMRMCVVRARIGSISSIVNKPVH